LPSRLGCLLEAAASPPVTILRDALRPEADLHLVGGTVRDALLELPNADIDLATVLHPDEVVRRLTGAGVRVIETGLQHGTVTAVIHGENIEITTFRTLEPGRFASTIEADLALRDFTMNALAWSLERRELLDPFNGAADLRARLLRAVGDPGARFREDPLRMMRLLRFGPAADRSVEPGTLTAISALAHLIDSVSIERVRVELERIIIAPNPGAALRLLVTTGLADRVLPELLPSVGFEQNEFHLHDVFEHTIWVIERTPPEVRLRLAALFHDLGKPASLTIGEDGRRHFYRHEEIGGDICREAMHRLRFSNEETKAVTTLVRYHMRPIDCGPAGVRRLIRDLGPWFSEWRSLKLADSPPKMTAEEFASRLARFDEMVRDEAERSKAAPWGALAIDGNDLIALGMRPGPGLGRLLRELEEAVIENPSLNVRATLLERARGALATLSPTE